ncbi:MAG: hypothetical protein AAB381_02400 [Patescibacteria group bacterium]
MNKEATKSQEQKRSRSTLVDKVIGAIRDFVMGIAKKAEGQ